MATSRRIALDAMGGDSAPHIVVRGAAIAKERIPQLEFIIFGQESLVQPLLAAEPNLQSCVEFIHTDDKVTADMKAAVALRSGRNSSMRLAINAVDEGRADCVVSAGNTGALMAMAKFVLKTLPGIDRPAIASFFPTLRGETIMLDLGANAECNAENLVQFAVMGALFAKSVLGLPHPTIGLLNIGSEESKGREEVRLAAQELRQMQLPGQFVGFIEGDDIPAGTVDVVVSDGFSGNIALKTAEGVSRLYSHFLRQSLQSSLLAKLGYFFARGAFQRLRARLDPRRYNGAMFLGLQGVCVKSHGGTDAEGFANAIAVAHDLIAHGFNEHIKQEMLRMQTSVAAPEPELSA